MLAFSWDSIWGGAAGEKEVEVVAAGASYPPYSPHPSRLSPCHLPQRGRLASLNNNLPNHNAIPEHTISGVNDLKEEEKKPVPWEAVDPRPPVIRSGHLENRRQN